jgi:inositol monophosphatase 3
MNMAPVNIKVNPIGGIIFVVIGLCVCVYVFGFPSSWFKAQERVSMKELLAVSIQLAKRGGDRVKQIRENDTLAQKSKGKTKEGKDELLTMGDLESHRAILNGLLKSFPRIKV